MVTGTVKRHIYKFVRLARTPKNLTSVLCVWTISGVCPRMVPGTIKEYYKKGTKKRG